MNISMGFLKPVSVAVKKYKSLLPSVIIVVVALLFFLLTVSKGGELEKKMDGSFRTSENIQRLKNKVPSKDEVSKIQSQMDNLQKQANKMENLAIQSSRRDLITYKDKIFPKPVDTSQLIYSNFGKSYREKIEEFMKAMNAKDAPSTNEILAVIGHGGIPSGGVGGVYPIQPALGTENPRVKDLCMRRSQEISVYVGLPAFSWYSFWESYEFSDQTQALEDCWDSQIAFWVYEDIVDTIKNMKGDTDNVLDSPVKRLLGIRFAGPVMEGPSAAYANMNFLDTRDKPNYVTPLLPSNFLGDYSPTGRFCNDDLDIIHFTVSVVLDNGSVFSFMKELCKQKTHSFKPRFFDVRGMNEVVEAKHNQITILQSDTTVVDKAAPAHQYYRYGKSAVSRLDLICEYQFYRKGYDVIKPEAIKERLGQIEDTEAAETARPGAGI